MTRPAHRPKKYNRLEILKRLHDYMAEGTRTMAQICEQEPNMPTRTEIFLWCGQDKELSDILSRAQRVWCMAQADQIIKICDDESRDMTPDGKSDNTAVNRDKLRVSTRQWAMARFRPDLFGDKVEQTHEITLKKVSEEPLTIEEWNHQFQRKPVVDITNDDDTSTN